MKHAPIAWLTTHGYVVDGVERGGGGDSGTINHIIRVSPTTETTTTKTASDSEVAASSKRLFVKTSSGSAKAMFSGEALGLQALAHSKAMRIPEVLHVGDSVGSSAAEKGSYLIMDFLDLGGHIDHVEFGRAMGRLHMAAPMHDEAKQGQFGFPIDNTIGATPQPNRWSKDWIKFYREQRIEHQLALAGDDALNHAWQDVLQRTDGLRTLFEDVKEIKPCVMHGDLWCGNMGAITGTNECVLFDPATYYGHHEAEWGMSWCASLGTKFWKGYREYVPEDKGFHRREPLYELYHKLNHTNLFGGCYRRDALHLMSRLQ